MPETTLAIDIGATNVAAAVARDGVVDHIRVIPAVVGLDADRLVAGDAARAVARERPDAVAEQVVRRLGDNAPVILAGRACTAAELLAVVVDEVVTAADIDAGTARLVLTHPAAWREHRLELLGALAGDRGFRSVELRSTPLVAAEATTGVDGHVLVVDAGGSTIEASVVAVGPDGSHLVATQSLERLGGDDFDQAVFTLVNATIDGMLGDLDRRDPQVRRSMLDLRAECTAAKERLSTDADTSIRVALGGIDTSVRITRTEFETAIRSQVDAVVALVDRLLASAEISADELAGRVVTGGSSQIPLLGELLTGRLAGHLEAHRDLHPDPLSLVAAAAAVAVSRPSIPTSPPNESDNAMTDETTPAATPAETAGGDAGGTASRTPGARPAPPPPPQAERSGPPKGAKLAAAGAAAAAAATGAAIAFGDDIAAAFDGDESPDTETPPDTVATPDPEPPTEADAPVADAGPAGVSMDEFDSVAAGPTGAAMRGPGRPEPAGRPEPVGRPEPASRPTDRERRPERPDIDDVNTVREARSARDVADAAPSAGAAAPAAAPDAPAAAAAPSVAQAVLDDAPVDVAPGAPVGDAAFDAAKSTLLERLESFSPPGADPEEAAAFRQELQDSIERFEPRPGQTTEDALAEMRDDFDQRVQDFSQDQKIDALIREVQRDNAAEAAAPPEPPAGGLVDDFDTMIAEPEPVAVEPEPVVVGEPEPAVVDDLGTAAVDAEPVGLGEGIVTTSSMRLPDGLRPTFVVDTPAPAIDDITGDAIYSEIVQTATIASADVVAPIVADVPVAPPPDVPVGVDDPDPAFTGQPVEIDVVQAPELVEVGHAVFDDSSSDFAPDNLEQLEEIADIGSLPTDDAIG